MWISGSASLTAQSGFSVGVGYGISEVNVEDRRTYATMPIAVATGKFLFLPKDSTFGIAILLDYCHREFQLGPAPGHFSGLDRTRVQAGTLALGMGPCFRPAERFRVGLGLQFEAGLWARQRTEYHHYGSIEADSVGTYAAGTPIDFVAIRCSIGGEWVGWSNDRIELLVIGRGSLSVATFKSYDVWFGIVLGFNGM
jgi:hypothetical protein